MVKKELIAHCNSLVKQVARKQLTIEDLRKKKGVPNTASLGECKQCKVHEGRYTDVIYENRMKDEKYRGEIENLEDQIEGLKKDIAKLQNEKTKLENDAQIEVVRLKAVNDQLAEAKALSLFFQGRLFPVQTPTHGATHAASVSMAGGGGESNPVSCSLFCVANRVVFSTTKALTLLCLIWTEAHTPRQVKMTVWPCSHGFAMDLKTGSAVRWQIPRMAINQHGG